MKSPEWYTAVRCLRAIPSYERTAALHASLFWDDDRLERCEQMAAGDRMAATALADVLMSAPNVIVLDDRRGLS